MQTFSTMRRNSLDKSNLRFFFLVIGLVVYIALSDIYYWLPPLFGIIYVFAQEYYERQELNTFYFIAPFMIFFEASKGLPIFSTLMFFVLSFVFVVPFVRKYFGFSKILVPFFIVYAYFGYFGLMWLLGQVFDYPFLSFSWSLLVYSACEIILIWFFMWILL